MVGIVISILKGDNGILNKAKEAKTKTEIEKFIENAKLAYSEIYTDKVAKDDKVEVTENEVMERLIDYYNYKITSKESDETNSQNSIVGIKPNNTDFLLSDKTTVKIIPIYGSTTDTVYYVELSNKNYKINYSDINNIELDEIKANSTSDISNDNKFKINDVIYNNSMVNVTYNNDEVIIKKVGTGKTTITVKYNDEIMANINVTLPGTSASSEAKRSITVTPSAEKLGISKYGKRVKLNVNKINNVDVPDNWKILYADTDYVYLIYGGYYPVAALENREINGLKTEGDYKVYGADNMVLYLSGQLTPEYNLSDENWKCIENATKQK